MMAAGHRLIMKVCNTLKKNVPNVHIAYIENVPEGADSEQVFRSLVPQGFQSDLRHILRFYGLRWKLLPKNSRIRRSSI